MTHSTSEVSDPHSVVYSVFPDRETAERLATEIVDLKLAACANLLQEHRAIYIWEGERKRSSEVAVIFKTTTAAVETLIQELQARHPYQTPAILAWPIASCNASYAKWISANVKL